MTITDAAMEVQYRGAPIPLVSLQITFFLWGHVKDAVSGRRRHSLPERSQLATLPCASVPAPHDMQGNRRQLAHSCDVCCVHSVDDVTI